VQYVKNNHVTDAIIITPFINQQKLINDLLSHEEITEVRASTIHSVQGGEAQTVIVSSSISLRTGKQTFEWLKSHPEIVNVAVTRAKKKLIVFGDLDALKRVSTGDDVWNELFKYAESNGEVEVVPPAPKVLTIGKSNGSISEDEFYKTMSHLCTVYKNITVKRNVGLIKVFPDELDSRVLNMEFDSVIFEKAGFIRKSEKPIMIFELDGGEHFADLTQQKRDGLKQGVCEKHKIPMIIIGNNLSKHYEYLNMLIKKMSHESVEGEQISLF